MTGGRFIPEGGASRLLLFLLLLLPASTQSQTILDSLTVDTPVIDVSGGAQSPTVTMYLRNPGGLYFVYAYFGHPDSATMIGFGTLSSGTATNGTWEAQVSVAQSTPPGTYPVYVMAIDSSFNFETLNSGESVTVSGGEAEPPVLASTPLVAPSTIDVSGGPDTVLVDFDLTDNASGVSFAIVDFQRGDSVSAATVAASLVAGDNLSGSWQAVVIIPQNVVGPFDLRITAVDAAFNTLDTNLGPALTVTGGDTVLPSASGTPLPDRTAVNVASGDQDVKVTITALDTYSGIASIDAYFMDDSGNSSGSSHLTELVSGDSLNGTWELTITFYDYTPEGIYHLIVYLSDAAGNNTQLEYPGVTVTVTRAPEADVTFRMDSRRLERSGLFRRDLFLAPLIHIFAGPNAGAVSLEDPDEDSVWTTTRLIQTGQVIHYAFALPSLNGDVFELRGEAGGRSQAVDSTGALILPVSDFDNIPPADISQGYAAAVRRDIPAGDPFPQDFDDGPAKTFFSADFTSLDANAIVAVRRYAAAGGGTSPPGIAVVAQNLYWGIEIAPATATFNTTLSFAYNFFGGVADPSALRLLRRNDGGQPWEIVPTGLNLDRRTLDAVGVSSFSEWTIGSTNSANTLTPTAPGVAGNPIPPDSTLGVGMLPTLSWSPAPGASLYDLYVWPLADTMPATPSFADLPGTSRSFVGGLTYNTGYHWRVDAKNLIDSTAGPVWTFTTIAVPNLVITDVQVPAESFSGQAAEISWTVTNSGAAGTTAPIWHERFYLSSDSVVSPPIDPLIGNVQNPGALAPGESYTNQGTFVIPNGLFGVYTLIGKTDGGGVQVETDDEDNLFAKDITITLTPPPDLRVDVFSVPTEGFSGQTVPVLYTVKNHGTTVTTSPTWYDAIYLSSDSVFSTSGAKWLTSINRTAYLLPESSYTVADNVLLPDTVSGPRYLYVITDVANHVYEYAAEDNNFRRADIQVNLSPPPDLVVTGLIAPGAGSSGAPVSIEWTVANPGSADANTGWSDRVSIGRTPVYDPDSVTMLGTFANSRWLARDSSYTRQVAVTLPNGISGTYYFHVETDWNRQVFESIYESNNVTSAGAPTIASLSPWPDLEVTDISTPSAVTANDLVTIAWTVTNDGPGPLGSGTWTDSVYGSTSPAWDSSAAIALTGVDQNGALASGGSYTAQTQVRIPPGLTAGPYYLYVLTDRRKTVFEHTDEGNNTSRSAAIAASAYPPVDLAVTSLTTDPAGSSGSPLTVGYSVTNTGGGATLVDSWSDVVYLSPDTVLDYWYDLALARVDRVLPLAAGGSYTRSISPIIPNGISGDYYLIVASDTAGKVIDADLQNNRRHGPVPVAITLTPSPDLSVNSLTAPSGGQAGQPLTVTWVVANNGADMAPGRQWIDGLFLSTDATIDPADARLGSLERAGPLLNGATYADTLEVVLPNYASGFYYLLAGADTRNDVYEHNAESNNSGASPITVTLSPPADLVVGPIVVPAAGTVGEDVTIGWTVENQGLNPAAGRMTDAVYFSADTGWDLSDLLLGTLTRDVDLAPGASENTSMKANLSTAWLSDSSGSVMDETPGLVPGNYYVIVRTDVRNNIRETDNTNNHGTSPSTMSVDVTPLVPGEADSGAISSASPRYYRVDVPANLDLRIRAASSIAYPSIDLFSAYDRMPTGNDYDHRNDDPNSLDREVLVPSTQAGSYYLMMRSIINASPFVTESYSVLAETLGFSVSSATPDRGGSGGFVTGQVQGAGFRPTSRIFLFAGTNQVAEAELRSFENTMEMKIRWDLRGVPLGTYDVEVRNQDNSTARLAAGFTVEPMKDPSISIGSTIPRALLVGRSATYPVRFTNTSNVDIEYFSALIAVPPGTEISIATENDFLKSRSALVPDSLVPEGQSVDDWVESSSGRFVPLIGRDLPPGEGYNCRITFRSPASVIGESFPMLISTKTATKEAFLEIQLAQIEKFRADILQQPAGVDPEYIARVNDPVAFAHFTLGSYVTMGLLDSVDVPAVGLEAIATAATGQWSNALPGSGGKFTPKLPGLSGTGNTSSCEAFFNFIACPAAIIDCFIDIPFLPPPISFGLCVFGVSTSCGNADFGPLNYIGCIGLASGITCIAKDIICRWWVGSLDPNDITGPDGSGDERWVARQQTLPYTIRFENDSTKATAPARRVTITQALDSTIDVRSLRLGSFGFGSHVYFAPSNVATFSDRLDLRDSMGIFVDVSAGIDIVNGRISWTFNTVDPVTGGDPADPFAGFLPVNDSTGSGTGFVSYTVRPNPGAKTRDSIHAKATIVFDINDPLDTPPIFNLVDAVAPVSSVRPLPPTVDLTSFPVHWGGVDDSAGSGLKHYTIYHSRDGGPYTVWLTNVTDTIAVFTGNDSSTYSFFSVATDTAGDSEAFKSAPDATTSILTGVDDAVEELPKTFALAQNYPNPFNPATMVRYDVPAAAWVRLTVYNVLGQEVTVLFDGPDSPGRKVVEWNAVNRHGLSLPSGVYFYRMEATNMADPSVKFRDVKKMMLIR